MGWLIHHLDTSPKAKSRRAPAEDFDPNKFVHERDSEAPGEAGKISMVDSPKQAFRHIFVVLSTRTPKASLQQELESRGFPPRSPTPTSNIQSMLLRGC